MNCTECNIKLEAYISGQLSGEIHSEISRHIAECKSCAKNHALTVVLNKVIEEEKSETVNPFMSTRVMVGIERLEKQHTPKFISVLRPVLIASVIVFAIMLGIFAGSLYKPVQKENRVPEELVYINDAELESLSLIANE